MNTVKMMQNYISKTEKKFFWIGFLFYYWKKLKILKKNIEYKFWFSHLLKFSINYLKVKVKINKLKKLKSVNINTNIIFSYL